MDSCRPGARRTKKPQKMSCHPSWCRYQAPLLKVFLRREDPGVASAYGERSVTTKHKDRSTGHPPPACEPTGTHIDRSTDNGKNRSCRIPGRRLMGRKNSKRRLGTETGYASGNMETRQRMSHRGETRYDFQKITTRIAFHSPAHGTPLAMRRTPNTAIHYD